MSVTINLHQMTILNGIHSQYGNPGGSISLVEQEGHSGRGVYAFLSEAIGNGAFYLPEDGEDAREALTMQAERLVSGEATLPGNVDGHSVCHVVWLVPDEKVEPSRNPPQMPAGCIQVNAYQVEGIIDAFGGEDGDPIVLVEGDVQWHSGAGLYGYYRELPEDGAMYFAVDHETNEIGNRLCERRIAQGLAHEV